LGFAISRQRCLLIASARGSQRTAPWLPRGPIAPVEKSCCRPWHVNRWLSCAHNVRRDFLWKVYTRGIPTY